MAGTQLANKQRAPGRRRRLLAPVLLLAAVWLGACGSGVNAFPSTTASAATLSAVSITFGQATVGTTASQHVILSNDGADPLLYLSLSLSDPKNFALSSTCGTTLAAGASCTLTLTFQPASTGSYSAILSLGDDAATSPQTIHLSGTGTTVPLPQASLDPGSVSFTHVVGSAPGPAAVTVTNTGSAVLLIAGASLSDAADFSLSSTCGPSLAPAASCTLSALFTPQSRGLRSATLTLTDNAGGVAGSTQSVPLSGTAYPPVSSVMNFGDSITCGSVAYPQDGTGYIFSTHGYAGLLDTALAEPAQNLCRGSDQAADTARLWVYPNAAPQLGSHQLYTVLIGTNDAHSCGPSAGCEANWQSALTASLTWLALPATDKTLGSAITNRTGSWSPDFYSLGTEATGPGATLTFPVNQTVAGRTLYLGYRVADLGTAQAGSASVAVDGVPVATLSGSINTGQAIHTINGVTDTVFVTGVPLGGQGTHTVTVTTTSAAAAAFTFVWAGVASGSYFSSLNAPRVLIGSITATPQASLQPTINAYNMLLGSLVSRLAADGMDVELLPTGSALDTSTDFNDVLHPNTGGHIKLAAVFEGVL